MGSMKQLGGALGHNTERGAPFRRGGPYTMFVTLGYIDPGLGTLLTQFLIAAVVGVGFYFRRSFSVILRFFGYRKKVAGRDEAS